MTQDGARRDDGWTDDGEDTGGATPLREGLDLTDVLLVMTIYPTGLVELTPGIDGDGDPVLTQAQAAHPVGGVEWATLERLRGLVLIHMLREVEGTFALERADAVLEAAGVERPDLDWLDDSRAGGP